MAILFGVAVVLFVFVCLILILLVIIQSDKGGGVSGAIGGGLSGANQVLGSQDTANILTRGTTIFAIAYMGLCMILSLALSRQAVTVQDSILQKRAEQQAQYSPSAALGEGTALPLGTSGEDAGSLPVGEGTAQESSAE